MGGVAKSGILAIASLLLGATAVMGWTAIEASAVHEVKVVLGVPGQEGQSYKVMVSNEQLEDVMDGAAIVVKVDGAEESELVAQISMKEKRDSRPRAISGGAGDSGGDSGW